MFVPEDGLYHYGRFHSLFYANIISEIRVLNVSSPNQHQNLPTRNSILAKQARSSRTDPIGMFINHGQIERPLRRASLSSPSRGEKKNVLENISQPWFDPQHQMIVACKQIMARYAEHSLTRGSKNARHFPGLHSHSKEMINTGIDDSIWRALLMMPNFCPMILPRSSAAILRGLVDGTHFMLYFGRKSDTVSAVMLLLHLSVVVFALWHWTLCFSEYYKHDWGGQWPRAVTKEVENDQRNYQ